MSAALTDLVNNGFATRSGTGPLTLSEVIATGELHVRAFFYVVSESSLTDQVLILELWDQIDGEPVEERTGDPE